MGKQVNKFASGHTAAQKRNAAYHELSLDDKMLRNPKKFRTVGDPRAWPFRVDMIVSIPSWERRSICRVTKGIAKYPRSEPIVSKKRG